MTSDAASTRHHRYYGENSDKRPEVEFGKDYDYILYSSAFRRLGGVTQVVSANETALFHNRMTHSLKVAQVGRRITKSLWRKIDGDPSLKDVIMTYGGGLDTRVVHAACIAHDLGHPPFGHIAEHALQELLSASPNGINGSQQRRYPQIEFATPLEDSFEGNAQTFRTVTKLSFRDSEEGRSTSLNLTKATLAALQKYPWPNKRRPRGVAPSAEHKKWGYYDSEKEFFDFASDGLIKSRTVDHYSGPRVELRTIEAQVMDWADDISYAIHDVEDFFRAGLIPLDVLGTPGSRFSEFFEYAWNRVEPQFVSRTASDAKRTAARNEVEEWLSGVRELLPPKPYTGTREDREALHDFASKIIEDATEHLTLTGAGLLLPGKKELAIIEVFKQLTWFFVIDRPSLGSGQHGQVYLIRELFRDLTSWAWEDHIARSEGKKDKVLPPRLKDYVDIVFNEDGAIGSVDYETDEHKIRRAVVDYIVSLTEQQAIELAARIHGRTSRSVLESWFHI